MNNQTPVKLNVLYRFEGEKGEEVQGNTKVSYGPDDVVVRIGESFMRVDLEQFYMSLDSNDPLRTELGEAVFNLQNRREEMAKAEDEAE